MLIPLTVLLDLIAVEQIKEEGYDYDEPESQGPSSAEEWDRLFAMT